MSRLRHPVEQDLGIDTFLFRQQQLSRLSHHGEPKPAAAGGGAVPGQDATSGGSARPILSPDLPKRGGENMPGCSSIQQVIWSIA